MKRLTIHCPPVALLALLVACSGSSANGSDASVGGGGDAAPSFDRAAGTIAVQAFPNSNIITLAGYFGDGPDLEVRTESDRSGACRLMTFTPSFCDPQCTGFDVCVDSQCESWPPRLNKGTIEWTWPGGQMSVQPDNTDYYSANGQFSQHGEVSLGVDGDTLRVQSMDNLVQVGDWADAITNRSGDAVLRWSNPVAGARVRLDMTDCVGSHGAIAAAEIECEGPDTGELIVPGAFLDTLDAGDWSRGECGSHQIIRYNTDSPNGSGFRFEAQSLGSFFYRPQ